MRSIGVTLVHEAQAVRIEHMLKIENMSHFVRQIESDLSSIVRTLPIVVYRLKKKRASLPRFRTDRAPRGIGVFDSSVEHQSEDLLEGISGGKNYPKVGNRIRIRGFCANSERVQCRSAAVVEVVLPS